MKTRTLLAVAIICATLCYCTATFCRHWFAVAAVENGVNVRKK